MTYQEFIKFRHILLRQGLELNIPPYYDLIDDNVRFTPKRIAQVLSKSETSIPRIRCWFSEGLSHGKIVSIEPTRNVVMGKELKEFLFAKDWKKISKQRLGKDKIIVLELINSINSPV